MAKKKDFSDVDFEMFIMPFGKYRNWELKDLPVHYVLWIMDQEFCPDVLLAYAELNEEDLREKLTSSDSFYDSY